VTRSDGRRPSGVNRIAVLRAGGLGDLMFALPALDALRAAYPDAEITLIGDAWHAELLAGRPAPIDAVAVLPEAARVHLQTGALGDEPAVERFFAAISTPRPDVAIQIHGGGRTSNPFVRRIGARLSVGLRTPDASPLDRWVPYRYYQHEVLRALEVVGLVGATPVNLEPRLAALASDVVESEARLPEGGPSIAVIHPGAGDPRRRWPPDRFAVVGDRLADAGARVVVVAAREEAELVESVGRSMVQPAVHMPGSLSIRALAGLLARASVVVANDSGPLHLAEALGAATVGVFWCGNLINAGPFSRARHRPHLAWRLDCPVCGVDCTRQRCSHGESFVADVPADDVASDALDLLRRGTERHEEDVGELVTAAASIRRIG
jgi:ADP-heptose:LPS heptosyltransferase